MMRGLSLTQPWSTLVAIGAKKFETRSWGAVPCGWIAIHASKGFPRWAKDMCRDYPFAEVLTKGLPVSHRDYIEVTLPTGAIVAVVNFDACTPTEKFQSDAWARLLTDQEREFGDFGPSRFAWRFAEVKRLPEPIPCKGALGLWTVPVDVEARIRVAVKLG